MSTDTATDYVTVEIRIARSMLRSPRIITAQERLAEDDALATMLGRSALVKGRAALMEVDE